MESPAPDCGVTRDRLALLVEAVQEYAIFMLDPDGVVVTWNPGAHRIKGYVAEEIIGQHFSVFYDADDVAAGKPARELADAIAQGETRDEGWRVRKDGTRFWADVVITAVHDDAGRLEGFAKVTRDDTERRQMAGQIRQLELYAERDRIANELLNTVVHQIFGAGLAVSGALQFVSDPPAAQRIHDAVRTLDEALAEIRSVVLRLGAPKE